MDLGSLVVTLGVDAYDLVAAEARFRTFTDKINSGTKKITTELNKISRDLKSLGRDFSLYVTAPLTLAGGAIFNTFRKYEVELAKIIGLTGTTVEQTAKWDVQIRSLAKDVAQWPQKLAEAQYFIASSGIDASKAFGVLEASAKAATAGLGEVNQIADLVTSALNAYKKQGITASQVTDILTAAVREGKQEATELAGAIGYVIPIASELGVTFDQVAAAMAAMSETGTIASTSATNLRQALADFLKPAKDSIAAMNEMKFTHEQLLNFLREKGYLTTLEFLAKRTKEYGVSIARIFPEVRGLTGVLSIVGENLEHNKNIFAATANSVGDTQNAFEAMTQTLDYRYKQALISVNLSMLEVGKVMKEIVIPLLEGFSKRIENLTAWFGNLSDSQKKWLLYLVAGVALLGPITIGLAVFAKSLVFLISLIRTATVSIGLFNLALNSNVIVKAAVVSLALGAAIYKLFTASRNAASSQKELNDEIERTKQLKEAETSLQSIQASVNIIDKLNQRQLETLRDFINERIKAEEDAATKELQKREETEKKVQQFLKQGEAELDKLLNSQLQLQSSYAEKTVMVNDQANTQVEQDNAYSHEKTLKELHGFLKQVETAIKGMTDSKFEIGGVQYTEEQVKSIQKYQTELEILDRKYAILGNSIKYAAEQEKIFENAFEDFVEVKLPIADKNFQQVTKGMKEWSDSTSVFYRALQDLSKELYDISQLGDVLNADISTDNLNAYLDILQKLQKEEKLTTEQFEYLKKMIRETNDEIVKSDMAKQLEYIGAQEELLGRDFDETGAKINVYMNELQRLYNQREKDIQQIEQTKQKLKELIAVQKEEALVQSMQTQTLQAFSNVTAQYFSMIGQALVEGGTAMQQFVTVLLQTAQQVLQTLLAEAMAAIILKESTNYGLLGVLIAGTVGVSALLAVWNKSMSQIKSVGMAKGGKVPPGYPNDSYPARLTSNEVVLPPGKFEDIQRGDSPIILQGNLEVGFDKLYLRLKRIEKTLRGRGMDV